MTLENATFVAGLDPSRPNGQDSLGEADDHLNMIKSVLRNQFAGRDNDRYDTSVVVGPRDLNDVVNHAQQTDLDALEARVTTAESTIVSNASSAGSDSAAALAAAQAAQATANSKITLAQAMDAAWPVGSVYISYNAVSPATKGLPGTWVQFGAGQLLMGGTEAQVTSVVGNVNNEVTLVGDNLPAHQHEYTILVDESGIEPPLPSYVNWPGNVSVGKDGDSDFYIDGLLTSEVGESAPIDITPRSIRVIFWRRTN